MTLIYGMKDQILKFKLLLQTFFIRKVIRQTWKIFGGVLCCKGCSSCQWKMSAEFPPQSSKEILSKPHVPAWKSQVSQGYIAESLTSIWKLLICFLFLALACTPWHFAFVHEVCFHGFLLFPLHPPACCGSGWSRQSCALPTHEHVLGHRAPLPTSVWHDRNHSSHCCYWQNHHLIPIMES